MPNLSLNPSINIQNQEYDLNTDRDHRTIQPGENNKTKDASPKSNEEEKKIPTVKDAVMVAKKFSKKKEKRLKNWELIYQSQNSNEKDETGMASTASLD